MNKQAIEKFNEIRDIPYHISVHGEAGSGCADKAFKLIEEFKQLNIEAKFIVGLMKWSDLKLPQEVTDVPHDDESSHAFVEIENSEGKKILIDPTWNKELSEAGFTIAEWDGESSTVLAINCYKIMTAAESEEYMKHLDNEDDLERNGKFYEAINEYCDSFLER